MAAPRKLCETAGMDERTWLAVRAHGPKGDIEFTIGGSDVATVLGVSPWVTPPELWREKLGLSVVDDDANSGQKEMGHLLEPIAAYWYGKKTGNKVINDTGLYQHALYPWALANLDYRFETGDGKHGILECKSTTYYKADEWADGKLPYHYELQGRFYMAVMDLDFCDFCCIWGNNPETDVVVRRIHRDRSIEQELFEQLAAFIECLEQRREPTMDGVAPKLAMQALARIYSQSLLSASPVEFSASYEKPLRRIAELQDEISDLKNIIKTKESEVEAHSVRIAEALKEYERGELDLGTERLIAVYKTRTTRRPNSDLLKKNYPEVYDDVLKTTHSRKVKVVIEAA